VLKPDWQTQLKLPFELTHWAYDPHSLKEVFVNLKINALYSIENNVHMKENKYKEYCRKV
jgi:hypothetical protein